MADALNATFKSAGSVFDRLFDGTCVPLTLSLPFKKLMSAETALPALGEILVTLVLLFAIFAAYTGFAAWVRSVSNFGEMEGDGVMGKIQNAMGDMFGSNFENVQAPAEQDEHEE